MDPAEIRVIRLVVIKESGGEVYWENPPVPHVVKAFKVTAASCTVIGN